jgi:ribosomal-protein-alanine N-acetyltransferase
VPAAVTIRPARPDESNVLGELGFAAWTTGEISSAAARVDREHVRRHFLAFCTTGWETIRVAEMDGRSVGWGSREHRDNVVTDLWVAPRSQGQGVGKALLDALESDIARAGYKTVELETAAINAGGIRFYERGGYVQVWRKVKFSHGLGQDVEKVRLVKPLGPVEDCI